MITQLSPLFRRSSLQMRPEDLLLAKGSWVVFSDKWQGKSSDWAKGRAFEVSEEPLLVPFSASYILPGNDYRDLDLSNSTGGLKLYPEGTNILYQIAVGFKPGSYITHVFVPKDCYVYKLGDSSMYPLVTDPTNRYLGAFRPEHSPAESPLLFLYAIKDAPALYLRPWVLDDAEATWDKVTIEFFINKCRLREIAQPSEEQRRKALRIAWHEELSGY